MKIRFTVVAAIIISIGLIGFGALGMTGQKVESPRAINGVLDLSDWSFRDNGTVRLDGEWRFYKNEFLNPIENQINDGLAYSKIVLPSTKNSIDKNDTLEGRHLSGTMRLRILLPESDEIYGLRSDVILTAYDLYLNDAFQVSSGIPSNTQDEYKALCKVTYGYSQTDGNVIDVLYHTSDYYMDDGFITSPQFGLASQITETARVGMGRDMFLFGMLFIMGIYHMVLFLLRRNDKAPMYYAGFCLAFSIRMLMVGERLIPSVMNLEFGLFSKITYISVFIGFSALCGFLYHALDGLYVHWFKRVTMLVGVLTAGIAIVIPHNLADRLLLVYGLFGIVAMVYILVTLIVGSIKRIPYASIILLGFVFLGITFLNDFIYQYTASNKSTMIPVGLSMFTLAQTYALSARFSSAFRKVEQLSIEKEAILLELRDVNSNLEVLVEERTSDLKEALSEMNIMSKTDYLTKLPNRRHMVQVVEKLMHADEKFSIGILDIDHFKLLNDTYGHATGDEVLIHISDVMRKSIEANGYIGRWGGEEFLIVFLDDSIPSISHKANSMREEIYTASVSGLKIPVTVTIGLCPYNGEDELDACIAKADKALYNGKAGGRNQCQVYEYS